MTIKAGIYKPDPQQQVLSFVIGQQPCPQCGERSPHDHEPDNDEDDRR